MLLSPNNICMNWQRASQLQMEKRIKVATAAGEECNRKERWNRRGQKESSSFSREEWDKHSRSEEWWVLSRMNIGPSVSFPAYPTLSPLTTWGTNLHWRTEDIRAPALLLYSSLPHCGRGDQVAASSCPAVQKANTPKLEAGISSWRSQRGDFCSSLKESWSRLLLLEEHDPWSIVNCFFTTDVVDWRITLWGHLSARVPVKGTMVKSRMSLTTPQLLDQLILDQILSTCPLNLPAAPFPKRVKMQIWSQKAKTA